LGEKMWQVVVLVDEEISACREIQRLQQADREERHQMQRIEPRETKSKEFPTADRPISNRIAIFPEKNEAADAPEDPHADRAGIIERMQPAEIRQPFGDKSLRLVSDERKMAIMKDQNRKRGQKAQGFEAKEFVGLFRKSGLQRLPHALDTPFRTASSHSL